MENKLSCFEKYLTIWVVLCIGTGILLGKLLLGVTAVLDSMSVYQVSIPIAICLFFMMYPIMVKIDFREVVKAGKNPKQVLMTLFINWAIKPFTIYFIPIFFLGYLFREMLPGTEVLKSGETVELFFIQTVIIFTLGYFVFSKILKLSYEDAAPASLVGASNHFEVAIATATMHFALSLGASPCNSCRCSYRSPCNAHACHDMQKNNTFFFCSQ